MTDDRHGEGTPQGGGRWDPLPQGDYDDGATAFVKLPEGGIDALLASDSPLAAPGHGYVPPQIAVDPGGTDPAATGTWAVPADGTQWPDPNAVPVSGDRFTYQPGATGHWAFGEHTEHSEHTGHGEHAGHGEQAEAVEAAPAPGHDVTGQWSIPVANGDLPDESGEFTTSSLVEQWGGTPPATLPGGASAPWVTQTGQPWGTPPPEHAGPEHAGSEYGGPEYGDPGYGAPEHAGPEHGGPEHREPKYGGPEYGGVEQAGPEHAGSEHAESVGDGHAHTHVPAGDTPPHAAADLHAHVPPAEHPGALAPEDAPDRTAPDAPAHEGADPEHGHAPAEPLPDASVPPASQPAHGPGEAAVAAQGPESAQEALEGAETAAEPHAEHTPADDEGEAAPDTADEPEAAVPAEEEPAPALPGEEHPLASYVLRVNGVERPVADAWIGESLLYVLRERLGLAGAKDGCSQGECGACNVQVDGRLVASCLVPAVTAAGSEVRTVEGLAEDGQPSDVQRALARCGAVQCGFCVPGMAMTVHDLLEGNPAPTELETRQALCGNLCRCSGYRGVVDAVKEVVAEREAHSAADSESNADEARIPHQAGPGAGGVNPSAFEPHNQAYGQDGGQA
ncbi:MULTISPECIES: 2Fe-2S iron-sulfur cluster-binding protein [unclassified Streptomyces]|uniref:2Fe-2S iron-sulfur cluster-binding protein n=1 Tax=unclassified Streptomyces TaxID=2593676 RepID=UPI0036E7391E